MDKNNVKITQSSGSDCGDLVRRLHSHIAAMAPHQRLREQGGLLIASANEITRLQHVIREAWLEAAKGDPLNVQDILKMDGAPNAAEQQPEGAKND